MVTIAEASAATRVSSAAVSSVEYRCISLQRATRSASAAGVGTSVGLGIKKTAGTSLQYAGQREWCRGTGNSNVCGKTWRDVHHTVPREFPRFLPNATTNAGARDARCVVRADSLEKGNDAVRPSRAGMAGP